jgi:hypothetical protein
MVQTTRRAMMRQRWSWARTVDEAALPTDCGAVPEEDEGKRMVEEDEVGREVTAAGEVAGVEDTRAVELDGVTADVGAAEEDTGEAAVEEDVGVDDDDEGGEEAVEEDTDEDAKPQGMVAPLLLLYNSITSCPYIPHEFGVVEQVIFSPLYRLMEYWRD